MPRYINTNKAVKGTFRYAGGTYEEVDTNVFEIPDAVGIVLTNNGEKTHKWKREEPFPGENNAAADQQNREDEIMALDKDGLLGLLKTEEGNIKLDPLKRVFKELDIMDLVTNNKSKKTSYVEAIPDLDAEQLVKVALAVIE